MKVSILVVMFCIGTPFCAVAKPKDRVIHPTLSSKEPGSPDYDHDAFLGVEEAEKFKDLTPEESRRRLGIIARKIDKDGDGSVTITELEQWIRFTQQRYVREDSAKQSKDYDINADGKIEWTEYMKRSYGFLNDENAEYRQHDTVNYTRFVERDKRKWNSADTDKDQVLTNDEFQAFLHPEEYDHMKDLVALETLEDIDRNKDGFITVDEYIQDMTSNEDDQEPEWVPSEKEHFSINRDTNGDGKMDVKEVRNWIFPSDYDHAISEAKHLISMSDENKDDVLSIEEIMENYDTFVGSQATDWGEALSRHDEF